MKQTIKAGLGVALGLFLMAGNLTAGEDGVRIKYKVGDGLSIGDGSNLLKIQGRVQGRFTYNNLESAADNDTWAIQRGKIKLEGHVLDQLLKYGFQMNLSTRARATTATVCTNAACTTTAAAVTTESTTGLATLEDYYIDWAPADYFNVKLGQFKVPFLMQELTSSGKQQFVDRALSTGFFNLSRDIGADFHGDVLNDHLKYDIFFMNGDGVNTINQNQGLMVGTRFEVPILGEYKTSESDTDDSEEHNLGLGVAYAFNEVAAAVNNIAAGTRTSHGTLDLGWKYKGWSLQTAGMLQRTHEGAKLTNFGYNAQAGYFFIPKKFEVAAKAGTTVFSDATRNQHEYSLGFNYFIVGHGIKFQTDYAVLLNNRGQNLNDHRFRTQMQLIF